MFDTSTLEPARDYVRATNSVSKGVLEDSSSDQSEGNAGCVRPSSDGTVGSSSGGAIRSKSPSPHVHAAETPIGLMVPSACCSETNTDSQERHSATILDPESDLLITCENDTSGYHHCSKVCWVVVGVSGATSSKSVGMASSVVVYDVPSNGGHRLVSTAYRRSENA